MFWAIALIGIGTTAPSVTYVGQFQEQATCQVALQDLQVRVDQQEHQVDPVQQALVVVVDHKEVLAQVVVQAHLDQQDRVVVQDLAEVPERQVLEVQQVVQGQQVLVDQVEVLEHQVLADQQVVQDLVGYQAIGI